MRILRGTVKTYFETHGVKFRVGDKVEIARVVIGQFKLTNHTTGKWTRLTLNEKETFQRRIEEE